jgi:hypothetical protein
MRNKANQYDPRGYVKNKPIIYLDLDGVLTDFQGHLNNYNKSSGLKITAYEIGTVDYNWWATMPWTKWGKDLYDYCNNLCYTCILSSAGGHPEAAKGKTIWLEKEGIKDYILSGSKWAVANNKTLLIDDTPKKVDKFILAGGVGLLFSEEKLEGIYKAVKEWADYHSV